MSPSKFHFKFMPSRVIFVYCILNFQVFRFNTFGTSLTYVHICKGDFISIYNKILPHEEIKLQFYSLEIYRNISEIYSGVKHTRCF